MACQVSSKVWMKVIYMYIGRRGTDEHARAKWAGQFETRGYRVRSLCAQCGCVNHRKFNGLPSLRVRPGSFDAKYHVYVYYYTANRRLCMGVPPYRSIRYQNCVGALPPQIKYCGGACPPCPPPPSSAVYDVQYKSKKGFQKLFCFVKWYLLCGLFAILVDLPFSSEPVSFVAFHIISFPLIPKTKISQKL